MDSAKFEAAETAQRAVVKKVCPRVQARVGAGPRSLQESVGSVEARGSHGDADGAVVV